MLNSIRSRLALSFAGIALVAAVALGGILLATLRDYYARLELDYLRGNAESIGSVMLEMLSIQAAPDEVQAQIENLAFLSQTRIQVYDQRGRLAYDSGSPQKLAVSLGVMKGILNFDKGMPSEDLRIISIIPKNDVDILPPISEPSAPAARNRVFVYRSVQAAESPFGFDLSAETAPAAARSRLTVEAPILDLSRGIKLGAIRLSEGPAYGSAILSSVAWGWALASTIAILLAALVGWYVSGIISAPVRGLTEATGRMARGDLSSRADIRREDELGRLARSFNDMADQVETTVTTLRRFVSDAAHELRTPLTALRTNLDLALEETDAAARLAFIARAQAAANRLDELSTNLLDLSRLEAAGQMAGGPVIDLAELLRSHSEVYASQAEQAGLTFEVDLPPISVLVRGDTDQISRAMDNLVDNACKFTPPGGTVRLTLSGSERQAVFSVTDTGIGIPADDLPQIFQRFHRGRNTNAYAGSGLGLAIVKAIAAAQGGGIDVHSEGEGKGSRFSLHLPSAPQGR